MAGFSIWLVWNEKPDQQRQSQCLPFDIIRGVNSAQILGQILAGDQAESIDFEDFSPADWENLLRLAGALLVAPLLYRQLKSRADIPPNIRDLLKGAYYRSHARYAYLAHELQQILVKFREANIPVILLKGIYLADMVYQDAGLRPMGDLDLLVNWDDIPTGVEILSQLGYRPHVDYALEVELDYAKHVPPYIKKDVAIELHWSIVNPDAPAKVDVPGLWERSLAFEQDGIQARSLCPEDLLLHLCLHSAQHYFLQQLRTLCDIQAVIRKYAADLDWEVILQRTQDWQAGRSVFLALYTTRKLLQVNIPEEILETLLPADFSPAAYGWAQQRIFQLEPALSDNFITLMARESRTSRVKAFIAAMLPTRQVMERIYGVESKSWRVWLRYPAHWRDRLRRYGQRSLEMVQADSKTVEQARVQQNLTAWLDQE